MYTSYDYPSSSYYSLIKYPARLTLIFSELLQTLSLVLLSAYYKFLGGLPLVAVAALLLYVGCYQVMLQSLKDLAFTALFLSIITCEEH